MDRAHSTTLGKGSVERSFGSVASLFSQHVAGYVGSSVERRGRHAEKDAAWSIIELQDLLDEWIVTAFTDRGSECPCRCLGTCRRAS